MAGLSPASYYHCIAVHTAQRILALSLRLPVASARVLVVVEKFKAHLVMIQRKSANPYARETENGPRPGGAVKAPSSS